MALFHPVFRNCPSLPHLFLCILYCAWLIPSCSLHGEERESPPVDITADIDPASAYEGHPLNGILTIIHDAGQKVDSNTIRLEEGATIKVDPIKEVKMASPSTIVLSIYHFAIPGVTKGLHVLPSITASVGGTRYGSIPSTYEVIGAENAPAETNISLKLEQAISAPTPFYPGQRARLLYRFYFNGNVELTEENLPLLEAQGLIKIGSKEVTDRIEGEFNIEEAAQEVEAISPGKLTFAPASIAGYAYREDKFGKRIYLTPPLRANTPSFAITVNAFPEKGKPASFNGAVGEFTFTAALLTPKVTLKHKLSLAIDIEGKGNLADVALPELCCQPGFSGAFRMSSLPAVGKIQDSHKHFLVELLPLSTSIQAIPSIEFSFFNPNDATYTVLHTHTIPLEVMPLPKSDEGEGETKTMTSPHSTPFYFHSPSSKPKAIEIERNLLLQRPDLRNRYFGNWWVMLIVPLGAFFVFYQIQWHNSCLKKKSAGKPRQSRDLFVEALRVQQHPTVLCNLLAEAFLLRLVESGFITSEKSAPEELPTIGISGAVRTFLSRIEESRFAGKSPLFAIDVQFMEEARALFERIVPQMECNKKEVRDGLYKEHKQRFYFFGAAACMGLFALFYLLLTPFGQMQDFVILAKKADAGYAAAEGAATIAERKTEFNRVLALYAELERKAAPTYGNGKLYYNSANSFFQVEEYPLAVLHYYRALALMPGDTKSWHNMDIALKKLELSATKSDAIMDKILFFHTKISLPRRFQLFFSLAITLLLLISAYIWLRYKWLVRIAIPIAICCAIMLVSLGISRYFTPDEGVLIHATMLYRDAGKQYAQVSNQPTPAGSKVMVLHSDRDGKWLQVLTKEGTLGYVPYTAIRVI